MPLTAALSRSGCAMFRFLPCSSCPSPGETGRAKLRANPGGRMSNEELVSLSAVELRRRIGTKEISPVELLDACLDRIEEVNPAVNAVTAMSVKRARKEAKEAETAARRGEELPLLHGLPTGIKDLEETKDLLTTYGSPLYRDFVPTWDNVMVGRVRAAGAVVVGKTNVPEFGAGANSRNPVWGATGNPFNPMLNPGGSSGGSAGGRAPRRQAAGMHRFRHRGVAAHSRRHVRRGGLPPLARHGRGRAAPHGLDADLGAGPDGPHGGRHLSSLCNPDRPARLRSAQLPHRGRRLRRAVAGRSRQPERRMDRGFWRRAGRKRHPRHDARQDEGDEAPHR